MLSQDDFVLAALVEEGVLDRPHLEEATRQGAAQGITTCEAIVASGLIGWRDLTLIRAETSEYPYVDLSHYEIDFKNTRLLPRATADGLPAFPLFILGGVATVGMTNPLDLRAIDQLRALLKVEVDPALCEPEALRGLIDRAYSLRGERDAPERAAAAEAGSAMTTGKEPIVAAVNQILAQGIDLGASDIHIGPDEHELHLRYRVDGTLQTHQGPSLGAHTGLVQRLKVMSNLDLTQSRRPQDGKFRIGHNGRMVDVRLSIIPTVCGENVVMRLLSSGAAIRGLAELGIPTQETAFLEQTIDSPHGMILVTGPTGSGKTTTLYTALKRLNTPDVNIVTIEDPVEIRMPLVRQVQVNSEIGMTFAGALRSVLRQDPDVVFVGEIRDDETARISVQAALTGHLVLSSLHTNDAAGAVPRLQDLGCPAFAINASLLCVIGQRLVKRVCPECAREEDPDQALLARFGAGRGDGRFVRGAGCRRCSNTGYRGRIGVYEVMGMTPAVRRAVEAGAGASAVRDAAVADGMRLMWRDGLEKAKVGLTTLEEVVRVVAIQATDADAGGGRKRPSPERPEMRISA